MTSGIGIQEPAQCCAALTQTERDKINRAIELGGDLQPGESAEIIPQDDLAIIPIQGAKQGQQQSAVVMPHEVLKRVIAVPFTAHMGETAGLAVEIPKNAVQRQMARAKSVRTALAGFTGLSGFVGGKSAGRAKISAAVKLGSKSFTW